MFSKTVEYALRATFYIAQKGTVDNKLPIDQIAEAIGSPQPFTAKILQALARNNSIISSVRGPNGGFFMTKKSRSLPVLSILEAMNEKQTLTSCIMGLPNCGSERPCPMHFKYVEIKNRLLEMFQTTTIGEVASDLETSMFFIKAASDRNVL